MDPTGVSSALFPTCEPEDEIRPLPGRSRSNSMLSTHSTEAVQTVAGDTHMRYAPITAISTHSPHPAITASTCSSCASSPESGDDTTITTKAGAAMPMDITGNANDRTSSKAHVASACANCKKAHLACDVSRPCRRCVALDKCDTCVDVQHKRRGRPRLRDEKHSYEGIPSGHMQTIPLTQLPSTPSISMQGRLVLTSQAPASLSTNTINSSNGQSQIPQPQQSSSVRSAGRVVKPLKSMSLRDLPYRCGSRDAASRTSPAENSPDERVGAGGYFEQGTNGAAYSMTYTSGNVSPFSQVSPGMVPQESAILFTTTDFVIARLVDGVTYLLGWNPEDLERSRSLFDLCHVADRSALSRLLHAVHFNIKQHDQNWQPPHPESTFGAVSRSTPQELLASMFGVEHTESIHLARKDGSYLRTRIRVVLGLHASLSVTMTAAVTPTMPVTHHFPPPLSLPALKTHPVGLSIFPPTPRQSISSASSSEVEPRRASMPASALRASISSSTSMSFPTSVSSTGSFAGLNDLAPHSAPSMGTSFSTGGAARAHSPLSRPGIPSVNSAHQAGAKGFADYELRLPPIKDISLNDPPRRNSVGIRELLTK